MPKISLSWREDYILESAQNLYDLPVKPPLRVLSLDNSDDYFKSHGEEGFKKLVQKIKDIGWINVGMNSGGGYKNTSGYISFIDFLINKQDWTIRTSTLDKYKADPHVRWQYLYIDYPGQMDEFQLLNPDKQADLLKDVVVAGQYLHHYRFVYPICQSKWDANTVFTSKEGQWKGASMYAVIKQLIEQDRKKGGVYEESTFEGVPDAATYTTQPPIKRD